MESLFRVCERRLAGGSPGIATKGDLTAIGGGDVSDMQSSLGSAVADAQAQTTMSMQASSAIAKMTMMNSINDALNKLETNAGASFKAAAGA